MKSPSAVREVLRLPCSRRTVALGKTIIEGVNFVLAGKVFPI
ncbi:hypothetical protein SAMN02745975_00181 [Geosporobacter subterraneus DSM 17957]|uniref:Uncharacterized protein n=1 Tax=Geosporobacter subterraneus DSM 17957 TaxID=1121919 RepID=A0A1M6C7J5_9FIRM|nr:hypothetical protein SAMN02745975_00181 [Geosporobacter subterraneus DSM 17957]